MTDQLDREEAKQLHAHYSKHRDGIRLEPRMASVCLICASIHVLPKGDGTTGELVCRNCRVVFMRYACSTCGATIDGRDPQNPGCRECGWRICTCGACSCP